MARLRPLLVTTLLLILVTAGAFGVRQVITGQAEPGPPSAEQAQQALATAEVVSQDAIEQFIQSGEDPCSLPLHKATADAFSFHADLPALIADSELIVLGTPLANVLEPPPGNGGALILTTLQVDEVFAGAAPAPQITVASGQSILRSLTELGRIDLIGADLCGKTGQLVLFLNGTGIQNVFAFGNKGWARINGAALETAPNNDVFRDYGTAEALLDDLRQLSQQP